MPRAKTFRVVGRDGYRVVDIKASVVGWYGTALRDEQAQRLVLVPRTGELRRSPAIWRARR